MAHLAITRLSRDPQFMAKFQGVAEISGNGFGHRLDRRDHTHSAETIFLKSVAENDPR